MLCLGATSCVNENTKQLLSTSIHCLRQSTTHTLYISTHIVHAVYYYNIIHIVHAVYICIYILIAMYMYRLLLLSLGPYTEDCCLLHQTVNYIYTCVCIYVRCC